MLAGVQVLLVDLQDAGARYFTYVSTTIEADAVGRDARGSPSSSSTGPNPVGGAVQGNVLDSAAPVVRRQPLGADAARPDARRTRPAGEAGARPRALTSASCRWRDGVVRSTSTRPACRSCRPAPTCATSRASSTTPGTCLFEGTNLSPGRGSDAPFSQVGAPWLDPAAVLARLGPQPGVTFTARDLHSPAARRRQVRRYPASRDPASGHRSGEPTMRRPRPSGSWWPSGRCTPASSRGLPAHFDRLAGQPGLREALDRGAPIDSILACLAGAARGLCAPGGRGPPLPGIAPPPICPFPFRPLSLAPCRR